MKALINDVLFLKLIKAYPEQTRKTRNLHVFHSRIDVKGKKRIVKVLNKPASKKELKRLEERNMAISNFVSSFVISKTQSFFQKLCEDKGFLAIGPAL